MLEDQFDIGKLTLSSVDRVLQIMSLAIDKLIGKPANVLHIARNLATLDGIAGAGERQEVDDRLVILEVDDELTATDENSCEEVEAIHRTRQDILPTKNRAVNSKLVFNLGAIQQRYFGARAFDF